MLRGSPVRFSPPSLVRVQLSAFTVAHESVTEPPPAENPFGLAVNEVMRGTSTAEHSLTSTSVKIPQLLMEYVAFPYTYVGGIPYVPTWSEHLTVTGVPAVHALPASGVRVVVTTLPLLYAARHPVASAPPATHDK